MTKKIAELEQRLADQEERLKALELKTGIIKPPEPIIATEIFELFNPLYYSQSGDKEKANLDNTLAALEYHQLSVEEWNLLSPEKRAAKTISFLTTLAQRG